MTQWILHWPTWSMIRILGFASYFILFVGVCTGIVHSMPRFHPSVRARLFKLHVWANGTGVSLGLLHGLLLIVDTYAPFTWRELLVPFAAGSHPILNGFGTLAIYGLLLLVLTSDIRSKLGRRLWHGLHLLAYPIFFLSLIHGLGVGTDSEQTGVFAGYFATAVTVALLTLLRLTGRGRKPHANAARRGRSEARKTTSL